MDALYQNSNWRLRANGIDALGDGSWINRISTMDNGNLLRELLILQAQMLQMQYAIYADQQQGLILQAANIANAPSISLANLRCPAVLKALFMTTYQVFRALVV